ncbi:anti-sigma factor [Rhodoferax sp.]|uniref:anti-sigma factor family protein n=1 Tax=Rhodoferax sp. TaxID=50421 RepID=UPI002852CBC8|nr:anti-sigma factor [Rhodoferax sp.]
MKTADDALDAALRGMYREVLAEPVPPALQDVAHRLDKLRRQKKQSWRGGAIAAGILLAFGTGWFSNGQLSLHRQSPGLMTQGDVAHEFVRQAGFAYAVYLPEKRHPVEVAASEQEHLVQWLSKRLGKPLKIPLLEAQGFALMGGRLLPGESGARAQFMFQNQQGQRVTLYLGALAKATTDKASAAQMADTQFRFESDGTVPSFYWVDQGFGYALSGQVDKATLMALSTLVYHQIQ